MFNLRMIIAAYKPLLMAPDNISLISEIIAEIIKSPDSDPLRKAIIGIFEQLPEGKSAIRKIVDERRKLTNDEGKKE